MYWDHFYPYRPALRFPTGTFQGAAEFTRAPTGMLSHFNVFTLKPEICQIVISMQEAVVYIYIYIYI